MEEESITLGPAERRRLDVMNLLGAGRFTNDEAAELLGLSMRQVQELTAMCVWWEEIYEPLTDEVPDPEADRHPVDVSEESTGRSVVAWHEALHHAVQRWRVSSKCIPSECTLDRQGRDLVADWRKRHARTRTFLGRPRRGASRELDEVASPADAAAARCRATRARPQDSRSLRPPTMMRTVRLVERAPIIGTLPERPRRASQRRYRRRSASDAKTPRRVRTGHLSASGPRPRFEQPCST